LDSTIFRQINVGSQALAAWALAPIHAEQTAANAGRLMNHGAVQLDSPEKLPMYQTEWGLEKSPFSSGLDPRHFFEGASQREALARMRFLVAQRRRVGLVLGGSGSGKSLLLRVFAEQSRVAGQAVAEVNLLGLSVREFYSQLGSALQATVRAEDDTARLFRQLTDRFDAHRLQGLQTVLLLDDLHQAGPDLLNQILRLTRTDTACQGGFTVIATADTAQLNRLNKAVLEAVELRIDLEPWDELDTIGYVQMALFEAGAERPLFDDDAMSQLHQLAAGVPRAVGRIADAALMAHTDGAELIDAEMVQAASETTKLPMGG